MRQSLLIVILMLSTQSLVAQQQSAGPPSAERSKQEQSETNSKGNTPADRQENLQTGPRPNAPPLGEVGEGNTDEEKSKSSNQSQPLLRGAFGPETWSNWALVVLAGIAALYSIKAFIATRRQADAAHKMFLIAQRPRIIVRNVTIDDIQAGELTGFFHIINVGNLDAALVDYYSEIVVSEFMPMMPPRNELSEKLPAVRVAMGIIIKPGVEHAVQISPVNVANNFPTWAGIANRLKIPSSPGMNIYIRGYVVYLDGDTRKVTTFCRQFNFANRCFTFTTDSDYEYADDKL